METQEQLIKMTPEELKVLGLYKGSGTDTGCAKFFSISLLAIGFLLRFLLPSWYWESTIFLVIISIVGGIAGLFLIYLLYEDWDTKNWKNKRIEQELKEGYKKIVPKQIQKLQINDIHQKFDTRSRYQKSLDVNISYDVTIEDKVYAANSDFYYKLKVGDTIYFHVAPHSNSVLHYMRDNDETKYFPTILQLK